MVKSVKRQRPDKGSLADKASKALGWSFLNNIVARFSTMGIGVALARLLGPHEFGAYAVSMVALLAVLSFNELGVSLAIVRWQDEPTDIVPTVTTISVVSSAIIYVGCFLSAPAFATAMGSPAATNVIRILAINVVIDGLVSTPAALMQRQFLQKKKMIADQLNTWVGAATSIGLAILHFGAMSLAIGRLAGCFVAAIIFIAFSPIPLRFGFNREKAGALFRFGMPLAGASIIVFAVQNMDQLIVGKLLGATALGYYALAFNVAGWPLTIFSMPVRSVAPALFSRLQNDRAAMRTGFLTGLGILESVTLPACLLISGAAIPVVRFVYGARWEGAASALVWLGVLAAIRILFEFIYDFFVVLAQSRVVFTVQLVWLIVLVPALVIGTKAHGIAGAAMAEVLVALCVVLPWYLVELGKSSIGSLAVMARLVLPIAAGAVVYVLTRAISTAVPQAFIACVAGGFVTLAVVALLVYRMRHDVTGLRATLRGPEPSPDSGRERVPGFGPEPWTAGSRPAGRGRQPWETAPMPVASHANEAAWRDQEAWQARPQQPRPIPNYGQGRPRPGQFRPATAEALAEGPRIRYGGQRSPQGGQYPPGSGPYPPGGGPYLPGGGPYPPGGPYPQGGQYPPGGGPYQRGRGPNPPAGQPGRGRRFAAAILPETIPMPALTDLTGPLQMYRDPGAWTPIFNQTINSMHWDPGRGSRRGQPDPDQPRGRHQP